MSFQIALSGVGIDVPDGWEAELAWAEGSPVPSDFSLAATGGGRVVAHLANFVMPAERGDYGSGAVEIMDANAVFVALLEFDRSSRPGALFESVQGLPVDLKGRDFSPDQRQRRLPGQSGLQRFFTVGERRFVLYVVIGSHRLRDVLAPEVNRLLRRITIR
ncbi:MAG: hypothetical protein AAF081_06170 [Actinomycetota bacterium]